jgi:hypothetical protein
MSIVRFLYNHKTKITGMLLVACGAVQANATSIQEVVSPHTYAWFTVGIGVLVAVLGFVNSSKPTI